MLNDMPLELAREGLLLNNLFQLNDGTWRANVRSKENSLVFEFGNGPTPAAAFANAISRFRGGPGKPVRENRPRVSASAIASAGDLLKELGL